MISVRYFLKKMTVPVFFCILFLLSSGCGYHMGSLAHPQLKTVAIAPVVNDTVLPYISATMRDELAARFMVDGTYKVVDMDEADMIVFVKVNTYTVRETGVSNYDTGRGVYLPSTWAITLNSTVSVSIPGRAELLLNNVPIVQTARFQNNADQMLSQDIGIKQACYMTAGAVVSLTTEAW